VEGLFSNNILLNDSTRRGRTIPANVTLNCLALSGKKKGELLVNSDLPRVQKLI